MALGTKLEINSNIKMTPSVIDYHQNVINSMTEALEIANSARKKGIDPKTNVEIYVAQDVATRTEGLVGPPGVAKRLKEMIEVEKLSKDEIVLQIAREIAKGDFSSKNDTPEEKAEQALRTALSYQTEGITAAPIEGIGRISIKNNPDGTEYLVVYYSGPIRSAGGTAQGVSVFIADVIRKELGLGRYKATNDEINRILEEVRLYNRIMHLQIPTSDEELKFAWKNIPIMISGDPTEKEEIGGYRNIESMETNKVRGGACLVINDGLVGRAKKIMKRIKNLEIEGWEWLDEISQGKYSDRISNRNSEDDKQQTNNKVKPDYGFVADALMGRPTFSGPTAKGGFRLRYGHSRNTGIAALGIHPATMGIVNDYLAPGTHIRTERPGKGGIVVPIDSIKPPIVKLNNGDVIEVSNYEYGVKIQPEIDKILFMGDILVGFGEFLQNNYHLCPAGFNEEWWLLELEKSSLELKEKIKSTETIALEDNVINFSKARELSEKYNIPLHPKFVPFWEYATCLEILELKSAISGGDNIPAEIKSILELIQLPHKMIDGNIKVEEEHLQAIRYQLSNEVDEDKKTIEDPIDLINALSPCEIRATMGTTIGARMGRPEKAKARLMKPALHGLFPLGKSKKVKRQLGKIKDLPFLDVYLGNRICENCKLEQYNVFCTNCNQETKARGICNNRKCRSIMVEGPCENCGSSINFLKLYHLDVNEILDGVYSKLGIQNAVGEAKFKDFLKNELGIPEIIEKGVLRAKYNLHVFRDGTIRYDSTDAPLTHFYPYEIGVSVEKLKQLGYEKDYLGKALVSDKQLLELKVQDIIPHESSITHLINVSKFVDDELEYLYKLPRHYNVKTKNDLIGKLVIGLAPHTSAGVIGRLIGFTQSTLCWAHPYWHSAKRRNCVDYNEELLIFDEEINSLKKIKIGTFIDKLIKDGYSTKVIDDVGTIAISNPFPNMKSIGISETTLEPRMAPIKNWILSKSDKWINVTTKSGSKLRMTDNHQQLVWDDGRQQIIRKNAIELISSDLLITRSSFPELPENSISQFNLLEEFSEKLPLSSKFKQFKDQVRLRTGGNQLKSIFTKYLVHMTCDKKLEKQPKKVTKLLRTYFEDKLSKAGSLPFSSRWYESIPLSHIEVFVKQGVFNWNAIPRGSKIGISRNGQLSPVYLDTSEDLFRFIGLLLSEGHIRDEYGCYQVNISIPHKELKVDTIQLSEKLMGKSYYKTDNDQVVNANKIFVYLFAYAWGIGTNALNKRIPDFMYNLPRNLKLKLLEGIIDGDGSLVSRTKAIQIYTANQKLGEDYRLLLSTLGFSATILKVEGNRFGKAIIEKYKSLGKEPRSEGVLYHVKTNGLETISLCKELFLRHPGKEANLNKILLDAPPTFRNRTFLNSNLFLDEIKSINVERKQSKAYCVEIGGNNGSKFDHNISLLNGPITGQCDGDEDGIILLLDGLLNFSKEYLPTTRGSKMDTPLVLVVTLNPAEVDDEAFNVDCVTKYPIELYNIAETLGKPSLLVNKIKRVEDKLGKSEQYENFLFTHTTSNTSEGPEYTRYKTAELSIRDKLNEQLDLAKLILAVDENAI
ncbi:MAG: DNA polymerase II large subunit, partial [Candidatus Heimdallarchaeota archaeon]|nr:DNA polymerase II large subunit [Candidatus Heimdallarchaeota archaeon]